MRAARNALQKVGVTHANYGAVVLADAPDVFWRLADGSGTSLADSSGNSHTGTASTAPTWQATSPLAAGGNSVTPAATSRLFIANASWMGSAARSMTAEVWFKTASTTGVQVLAERRAGITEHFFLYIRHDQGHQVQFGVDPSNQDGFGTIDSPNPVNDNTWHHVVGTYATVGSDLVSKLYLDGAQVSSTMTMTGKLGSNGSAELSFGGENDNNRVLVGSIAECAYWGTQALSAARIAAHYAARL